MNYHFTSAAPGSWTDDEPGAAEARDCARLALKHARRRWIPTLLIAAALTAVVVHHSVTHPPRFAASVVVSVTETGFDDATKPPSSGELDKYVHEVFLARSTLAELIDELDLYPDKSGPDPSLALEAMGDDLEVRVGQNYFDAEREVGSPVRSARIVIEYTGRSPDHAHALVRRLAERFSEQRSRSRRSAVQAATFRAETEERALFDQMRALAGKQAELELLSSTSPLAAVQLGVANAESTALQEHIDGVARMSAGDYLRGSLEEQQMGLRFDLIEVGRRPTPLLSRNQNVAASGLAAFALFFPLSVLGMGILPRSIV